VSVLFSKVTVSDGTEMEDFLVGGIPRDEDDLSGRMAYEHFMEGVEDETDVKVRVEAYLYGGGETNPATPEEVAYFYSRIANRSDFLADRCDNVESSDFTIHCSLHNDAVLGFLEM